MLAYVGVGCHYGVSMLLLLFKALHLIAAVAWFAGLFYLPRLFVYHVATRDKAGDEQFQVMERRLLKVIMTPAMFATLLFGVILLALTWSSYATSMWVWLKIAALVGLIYYHFCCAALVKKFASGTNSRGENFFRLFNEIPTIALVIIILLAVFKPVW